MVLGGRTEPGGVDTAQLEGPERAVGPGVLHTEVEDGRVGDGAVLAVELLRVEAVAPHLLAFDHDPTLTPGTDNRGSIRGRRRKLRAAR